jgi:hypothetical protein
MIGILVRNSDNRIVGTLDVVSNEDMSASTPVGQTFYENVDVDKLRMRYAYYDGSIVTYTKSQSNIDAEEKWVELRRNRDELLLASDFTQIPDSPLTAAKKLEWQVYRQAVRDLPDNVVDVFNPIYPTPPA